MAGTAGAATPPSLEAACSSPTTEPCAVCLCTSCREPLRKCDQTSGCGAITQCVFDSGCAGIACYCGTIDALRCATGQADGPCKDTILSAPGGKVPTLVDPSAGPAMDAALEIAACTQAPNGACAVACDGKVPL